MRTLSVLALLAGLAVFPGAGLAQSLDTAKFTAACTGNDDFLQGVGGDADDLGQLCGCLLDDFVAKPVSQADLDMLATDLDGSATPESQTGYENYEDLSAFAGQVLNDCLVEEGILAPGGMTAQ